MKAANLALSYKFGAVPFYGLYDTFVYRGWQKSDVKSMIFHTPVKTEGEMKSGGIRRQPDKKAKTNRRRPPQKNRRR